MDVYTRCARGEHGGTLGITTRHICGLGQGRRYSSFSKIVRLNRPFGNVPEPEIQLPEQDSVPNGAVVAVSIDGRHRFSKISRLSITLTRGRGIEGDAHYGPLVRHRYLARRNPKAPNLRQVHLIPSELFDALQTSGFEKCAPEISARTSLRSGSTSNASPWARCSGLAPQRRSNLPASARPASSSIASSPD